MRTLAFDIGNTQIKIGLFEEERIVCSFRLMTSAKHTTDEFGIDITMLLQTQKIDLGSIDKVAISCVVPELLHSLVNAVRRYLGREPLIIGPGVKTGVRIKTANPKEVGADLIADVAAGSELYGYPIIIVDFGTVTKFEVVNEDNEFMACVFAPGLGISAEAMTKNAAQLPSIAIQKPRSILATETVACMQAGVVYGYIGQVSYIVDLLKKAMKCPDIKVVATGGFGSILAGDLPCIDTYDSYLTLKGIRMIAEKNKISRRVRPEKPQQLPE